MSVLLTGGLGYIGSHTCVEILNAGFDVVIADNLYNSSIDVLARIEQITGRKVKFYQMDIQEKPALDTVFSENKIDSVIHFAGLKAVGESSRIPLAYYRNNIDSTLTLLEVMEEHGCTKLVFSSSATVYGPDNPVPYREEMPCHVATNPYGWTKAMIEQILHDYTSANPKFSAVLLRYFNPIGAHESGLLGDDPNGIPNNLMPYIARVAARKLEKLTVYGDDYDTPDGTCLRDYLHVVDLAKGHLKALSYAENHCGTDAFNLGTGNAVSVLELVNTFAKVNNVDVPCVIGSRREGDLPSCFADATKAEKELHWKTEKTVEDMCRDSWNYIRTAK